MKTGIAHLPLHYGKAPAWLFNKMSQLARAIVEVLIREHGVDEFLSRISDPFWFQAFGCVLGFDWHSSGLTTTVCGALKEGIKDISQELGIFICGGKGAVSRKTPIEIREIGFRRQINIDPEQLVYASKMSAKIDSCALQDGYQLYHHCFIFTRNGNWAVIQQGMNPATRWARRYHWLSKELKDFVCEPHKAICCDYRSKALNMVAKESQGCRVNSTALAAENPQRVIKEFITLKELKLSSHHTVSLDDIKPQNLKKILEKTYEIQPGNFEALLSIEGVGPKTIRALALISELIYGNTPSWNDPVRFSFAHGGKDGHPYVINRKHYEQSIQILKDALLHSKIGKMDKLNALKKLSYEYI